MNLDPDALQKLFKDYLAQALHRIKQFQFGMKAQLMFLEDFSHLVEDGIPPNRAIEMLARVALGVNRDVAQSISRTISAGKPLADGMREWFAVNVVEIIRIGEEGGALSETIKSAINVMTQRSGTTGAFVSAILYPATVVIIASAMIIYLNNSVFPEFLQIKPMSDWPDAGVRLVHIAHFIESWWWATLLGFVVIMIVLQKIMINYTGEYRVTLDKIFPFTLYRRLAAAQVMQTLGLLVANGVVFKSALTIMQHSATPYLHFHLSRMERLIGSGKGNIADVLDTGLIAENDLMRLRIMAEVKGFEHGLTRLGVRAAAQGAQALQTIAKAIGGVLMLVGTVLILVAISGVYQTGMSMGSTT